MNVDPAIAALRHDPAPQRRAQERLERAHATWRANHRIAALEAELAGYGSGLGCNELPLLAGLFDGDSTAPALIDDFLDTTCAAMHEHPLIQLGLRHFQDDRTATLLLARSGGATLTLQACDGTALGRLPSPETVIFTPNESIERIIAGSARAKLVTASAAAAGQVTLCASEINLTVGKVLRRNGAHEAVQFEGFAGSLLILKLQRRLPGDQTAREYRVTDGRLVNQAAGHPRDSRMELAAALLGRMGRVDAAPFLAAVAEEAGSDSLRWQALRECLALDSGQGFGSLCRIAADASDPLAAPAGALRAQLLESWPQLSEIDPCRVY